MKFTPTQRFGAQQSSLSSDNSEKMDEDLKRKYIEKVTELE